MKTRVLALCLLATWVSEGRERTLRAPCAAHADTEATTNCPFDFGQPGVGNFMFDMSFVGTVSNNVQLAFGRDADGDGVLSGGEAGMMFAWDCGEWRLCCPSNGEAYVSAPRTTNEVKRVHWDLRLRRRHPRCLMVDEGGECLFAELADSPAEWLYAGAWNILRLTVRGVDAPDEDVRVSLNVKGYVIKVR